MKTCDICGTKNIKSSSYCIHCGNKIIKDNICPKCGKLNNDSARFCISCSNQLKPIAIDSFEILFNDYNLLKFCNYELTYEKYKKLLDGIFEKADYVTIQGEDIGDKIIDFCNVFGRCVPKSRMHMLGENLGNMIIYDDRLDKSIQIATLIHELAHCLLFNFFVDLICDMLDIKPSVIVECFVNSFLADWNISHMVIANEFYASSVASRFVPFGYQDYGSFLDCCNNIECDIKIVDMLTLVGNIFAFDVSKRLEKYITDDLRKEISFQYRMDDVEKNYDSLKFETDEKLDFSNFSKILMGLLKNFINNVPISELEMDLMGFVNKNKNSY